MSELTAEQSLRERCLERVSGYDGETPLTCTLWVQMADVLSRYVLEGEVRVQIPSQSPQHRES